MYARLSTSGDIDRLLKRVAWLHGEPNGRPGAFLAIEGIDGGPAIALSAIDGIAEASDELGRAVVVDRRGERLATTYPAWTAFEARLHGLLGHGYGVDVMMSSVKSYAAGAMSGNCTASSTG